MAEHSTPEQRTEMPTERRITQVRKEGALFISSEIVYVLSMMTGFYALVFTMPFFLESFQITFRYIFQVISNPETITVQQIMRGFIDMTWLFGPILFLFVGSIALISSLGVLLQTKWNLREKWIKFDFKMINPIGGLKRIFSVQGLVSTGKAIAKLALILPIAFLALKPESFKMVSLLRTSLDQVFTFVGQEMSILFWKIMYVMIAIAIFDFVYGKFQWLKNNKMTKDEVTDEKKSVEGDETTRRKIVAKGLQRIVQRIQKSVPKADVIITNPTHYAVALKYDKKTMGAPTVVAKGTDFLAAKIREIAKSSGIPIVERKALARALYSSVEVGKEIPYELFKAVAEVLAYVYRLKNPWGYKNKSEARM